jgi:Sec-independent protein translocase protein TatA
MTNRIASALGKLAKGFKKTMTEAALEQRRNAAHQPRPKRNKRRSVK